MRSMIRLLSVVLLATSSASPVFAAAPRPTNLVFILTDNQGAWTLGCYGNTDIDTPHIDRLAAGGVRFTRAFSPNGVCSPTRATLLTGLMPSQHGVHSYLGGEGAQMGEHAYNTIAEFRSLPEILAEAGYTCGLVGKWHLGANATPQDGFTTWITKPTGHTSTFYGAKVVEDGRERIEEGYLTDLWTTRAVRFLEENREQPFFLFLSYNGPYNLGGSLNHPARNRHAERYANEFLPSFPRDGVHPWLHNNKQFLGNLTSIRRVAAETSGVDDGVGEVVATLDRLGLTEDTLVVYTADQGWIGGQNGLWGMGDHTRPLTAFDGMMHVPLLFRQPGTIPAETTSDLLVSGYDILPTLLTHLGLGDKIPTTPKSPGRDFSAVLRGDEIEPRDAVYYEMENVRAIRTAEAKYVHRHPDGPFELYDLTTDPGEKVNLYGQPGHESLRDELRKRLEAFFAEYVDPQYDLYRDGASKSGLRTQPMAIPLRPADGSESRETRVPNRD